MRARHTYDVNVGSSEARSEPVSGLARVPAAVVGLRVEYRQRVASHRHLHLAVRRAQHGLVLKPRVSDVMLVSIGKAQVSNGATSVSRLVL